MNNIELAAILDEMGTLLEIQGQNRFRTQAYHNAARALEQLGESVADLVSQDRLGEVPGIGQTLKEKVTTLVTTGRLAFYEALRAQTPPALLYMLHLPGIGPKKVQTLHAQLGITSLEELKAACMDDRVAALKGFGAKTQQKILDGIGFLGQAGKRLRVDQAQVIADSILEPMRSWRGLSKLELCGSLRRRKETINDLDFLVCCDDSGPIMDKFAALPGVTQVVGRGETKLSVVFSHRLRADQGPVTMPVDLRVVRDDQFPFALHYFTGSKEHNIAVRARAQAYGLKLNEYELAGPKRQVKCRDEADLFRALDLDYIPPELRENTGELAAAEKHQLPDLVKLDDLTGVFHCHTDWSDGSATIAEMAEAARRLGFQYLGLADHSQSLTVARGLTPARVREQQKEIDTINRRMRGFRIFKGIECDILADGALDFDDDTLATFDYVVASVHSHFGQSQADMTARIVRAVSHPYVTMLGHATGRLLLRRDGYKVDLDAVLQAAAKHGALVEINSDPHRLDLDWIHCKRARELGIRLVINPDAHSTEGLDVICYGIDVARRAWLTSADILNTRSVDEIAAYLTERKNRAQSLRGLT